MHNHFLLLGLSLFALSGLSAQSNFKAAYVIQLKGDTLYGEIDSRGDEKMALNCRFRENKKADEILFYPSDIIGFRFTEGKYYVAQKVENNAYFLEFMIKGKINLYYRRDETGDHYYIQKEGDPIEKLEYEEHLVVKDGKDYLYQSKKHIQLLYKYTDRLPQFEDEIERIEKPDYRPMLKLAEDYHNTVCQDEACIVYSKELPFIKSNLELGMGTNTWSIQPSDPLLHYNLRAYIWLPRANENLYFKTGLTYIVAEEDQAFSSLMIPLQITYLFPTRIFKPHFSGGFNYFTSSGTLPVVGAGFNLALNSNLALRFNAEVYPISVISDDKTIYALEAGLYLSL